MFRREQRVQAKTDDTRLCPTGMEELQTTEAPESIGPYSQGIKDGDRIFVSGQGPVDPNTGDIIEGDIQDQTSRTLENIEAVLQSSNRSLDDIIKSTIYVRDVRHYDAINEIYATYMSEPFPARSVVEVDDLPINIGVEIEVIAKA